MYYIYYQPQKPFKLLSPTPVARTPARQLIVFENRRIQMTSSFVPPRRNTRFLPERRTCWRPRDAPLVPCERVARNWRASVVDERGVGGEKPSSGGPRGGCGGGTKKAISGLTWLRRDHVWEPVSGRKKKKNLKPTPDLSTRRVYFFSYESREQ